LKNASSGSCRSGSSTNIDKPFSPSSLHEALSQLGVRLTSSFVVAYSGGLDSHSLLHALHRLTAPHGARLRAVHVDHGLQAVSGAWSKHCLSVCAALNVPCAIERIEVVCRGEESTEAAARRLRYERLSAHVESGEVLLTAHHENDQAETVLLALLRGTGAHGLAAMPGATAFGKGRHARPLLGFSRAALAAYAAAQGLSWVDDASNADEGMSRNFLRARVLPMLASHWPAATRTLARAAANSADTMQLLDEVASGDMAACERHGNLSVAALRDYSVPRQRNAVRFWIRANGFYPPSSHHLDQILTLIASPPESGVACVDWPKTEVHYYRDELVVRERLPAPNPALAVSWDPSQPVDIPDIGWRVHALAVTGQGLSRARAADAAMTVRLRQGGEICQLAGHAHHHKLKKLLQEAGVPPWERERLPLIYAGDELAAIGDRWVCQPFAAKPDEPGWRIVLENIR
jgi:tRNA(Ile)-lysidine synthase